MSENTLSARWRWMADASIAEAERQSNPRTIGRCGGQDNAWRLSAAELEDACTPRPPNPEWFGTGPGQWDAWWVRTTGGKECFMNDVRLVEDRGLFIMEGDDDNEAGEWWDIRTVACVVPVSRDGFPAPAGWQVVEP